MKGVSRILSQRELGEAYISLATKPFYFSEKELTSFVLHSRLDPRLAEVVTEHIRDFWWKYDPSMLNKYLSKSVWPQAILVIMAQIDRHCGGDKGTKADFRRWSRLVASNIKPNKTRQLFFIGLWLPGTKQMSREVSESTHEFLRNGFFGRDLLFNKQQPKSLGSINAASTKQALKLKARAEILKYQKADSLSGKDLAARIGLDATSMSNILSGKLENFSVDFLCDKLDDLDIKLVSPRL